MLHIELALYRATYTKGPSPRLCAYPAKTYRPLSVLTHVASATYSCRLLTGQGKFSDNVNPGLSTLFRMLNTLSNAQPHQDCASRNDVSPTSTARRRRSSRGVKIKAASKQQGVSESRHRLLDLLQTQLTIQACKYSIALKLPVSNCRRCRTQCLRITSPTPVTGTAKQTLDVHSVLWS